MESFSRYILTKDNSKISGKYIETVMLGRIAGDDNVEIGCIFSFQDSSDFSKCGTGQVKITATIANKRVLSGKDKFDLNFCDRFASVWAYVDLSSFDAQDELKCSFSVKDKVKLAIGGVNGIGGGKVDISALARKSESFPDR